VDEILKFGSADRYSQLFKMTLRTAHLCVFEADLERHWCTVFENAEAIFGVSGKELLKRIHPLESFSPENHWKAVADSLASAQDAPALAGMFWDVLRGKPSACQVRLRTGETSDVWCRVSAAPVLQDGRAVKMIGVLSDISDLQMRMEQLENASQMDSFTGLYNKCYFEKRAKSILNREGGRHALLLFDLDNFKAVNDTLGHQEGDHILISVARNLRAMFRRTDVIGRFGGDEFIVLLRDFSDGNTLRSKLDLLTRASDHRCRVTKSIGVSLCPENGTDFNELLKKADVALYYAKRTKSTYTLYSEIPPVNAS
jgi:diguanylate cyclase (GGDEF)-like protein